jgi:hypothetical protein
MNRNHPIPRGVKHLSTFTASGLILALIAVAGLIYSSSGSVSFGPDSAIVLDAALIIGVSMMCLGIAVLLVEFP